MWVVLPKNDNWQVVPKSFYTSFPDFDNYWNAWAFKCALEQTLSSKVCTWDQYFKVLEKLEHLRSSKSPITK